MRNQVKLDKVLANQTTIVTNQAKLDQILANQQEILGNQKQILGADSRGAASKAPMNR